MLYWQLDDHYNSNEKLNGNMRNEQAIHDENAPKTTPCSSAVLSCCSHRQEHEEVDVDCVRKVKNVGFSDILIRRYDITCTGFINDGPGIGLDWYFTQGDPLPLDSYEQSRPTRRSYEMLILGPRERVKVLTKMHGCEIRSLQRICSRKIRITKRATTLSTPAQAA